MNESTNNITLNLNEEQVGEIKVHSQIINDLSSGIYSSPASCIKELVNNSFDADAENVVIRMRPIEDSITIWDDGHGMNAKDFDQKFAWISRSYKRERGDFSINGRPLIGKIGIGFIAVNEICEILEVTSSKKGENIKFTASIDFSKITNNEEARILDEEVYLKGQFKLVNEFEDESEHYTSIKLIGLKEPVLKIFNDETYKAHVARSLSKDFSKVSFKTMKDLLIYHSNRNVYSWEKDTEYIQFIIDLASYIPVEYIDGGPIEFVEDPIINEIVNEHKNFNFKVDFDGMYLKKPVYFPFDENKKITHTSFSEDIPIEGTDRSLKFKGYFYIQNVLLVPRELNGVSIRIKNIPIAERFGFDGTFMRYPNYTEQIYRNWISSEIYIEKGLEEAMNIDRKSFRVTHPDYLTLQNFLHKYLKEQVFKQTINLYHEGKKTRDKKKEKEKKDATRKVLNTSKVRYEISKEMNTDIIPIKIAKSDDQAFITVNETIKNKFKKSDWDYLEPVFIIFETAYKAAKGDIHKFRELFYQMINELKVKK